MCLGIFVHCLGLVGLRRCRYLCRRVGGSLRVTDDADVFFAKGCA